MKNCDQVGHPGSTNSIITRNLRAFISFRAGGRLTLGEGGRGLRLLVFAHTGNKESFAIPKCLRHWGLDVAIPVLNNTVQSLPGLYHLCTLTRVSLAPHKGRGASSQFPSAFIPSPLHRMFFCVEVWESGERVPGCSSQGTVSGCRLCWHSLTPRMGTVPQCTTLGGAVDFLGRMSLV